MLSIIFGVAFGIILAVIILINIEGIINLISALFFICLIFFAVFYLYNNIDTSILTPYFYLLLFIAPLLNILLSIASYTEKKIHNNPKLSETLSNSYYIFNNYIFVPVAYVFIFIFCSMTFITGMTALNYKIYTNMGDQMFLILLLISMVLSSILCGYLGIRKRWGIMSKENL